MMKNSSQDLTHGSRPERELSENRPWQSRKNIGRSHRPTLFTSRGCDVAVMLFATDFEADEDKRVFMLAIVIGLNDHESGQEISLKIAQARLRI
jgi:hypothetical protein